jgi:outer membrane protein assembly factor BamB
MVVTHLGTEGKGAVTAFDLKSGDVKWKSDGDGPAYGSPSIMTADGVKQIVEETEKGVVGLNLADGKLLWQFPFGGGGGMSNNTSTPIVDGQTLYASGGAGTKAARIEKQGDAFAAKELWNNPQASIQYNTPVLVNEMLFGFSKGSTIFCLSAKDGKTLWMDTTNYNARGFGSVVAAGPVVFVLTQKADLIALQPNGEGYKELAKYKIAGSEVYAYPVISGKNIFIRDTKSVALYELQ